MSRLSVALVWALLLAVGLTGCSRDLYTFRDVPKELPPGVANLLVDSSFESSTLKICGAAVNCPLGWSTEHTTEDPLVYSQTPTGAVTGSFALSLVYNGHASDDGVHKFIELYQGAVGPTATGGHELTFTLWVSGTCENCAPFIGIEAFDKRGSYLGESDQYFNVPATPRPVQVSYVLPAGTVAVAAYIQVPEIYSISIVNLYVDNASLAAMDG